ncbi:DUF1493 family protein [Hymenobacter busanensis]|uniref:DUF1493 family protein n=1 Tax=Hymenobacter busanensis TaxID=2607656 RepID=UPI0013670627|nr:DUF1493 family protein [Hymenobacter busanensis]QHJ06953.1 DUF1493 family protein [Hymenobacter busanensis]
MDCDTVEPTSDILADVGVAGDDFHELMEKYAEAFSVDMSGYLWYFHTDEEGGGLDIGGSILQPPYERVKRIPVTPAMLADFANKGAWDLDYPPHRVPKWRYDILINNILVGALSLWLGYKLIKALLH